MKIRDRGLNWKQIKISPCLWLSIVILMLYGILYIRFLAGEFAYMYTDIGSDTFDINYPLYTFFSRGYQEYSLNVGLGMDMSSYLYQYYNPINLFVVLLPENLIPWGIMVALLMKLEMLGIFSYKLFAKLTGEQWGSFAGALIWTFSGYVMLWGQHYGFCTSLAMFTVFLYLTYLYIEEKEKSQVVVLVIWVTFMLFTSYYFLYMTAAASVIFVILYMIFHKKKWKLLIKKLVGLAGMGILGVCIGGQCLVTTLNTFMESTRSDSVTAGTLDMLFTPSAPGTLYGFLARFFSNNTLGIGNDYVGAGNYYEIAMLFTTAIFLIVLPYLIIKKESKIETVVLTTLSILALIFPISSKLFTLTIGSYRWTYFICFLEAYACAWGIGMMRREEKKWKITVSVLMAIFLTAVAYGMLFYAQGKGYLELNVKALIVYVVFLLIYASILLLRYHIQAFQRLIPVMFVGILFVEILVTEFPTINDRENPTRNQLAVEGYNDGTRNAVKVIDSCDKMPYRIIKTYESGSENDGIVQEYAGLRAYMTTNPASWITYRDMYGGKGISNNFVEFRQENYVLNSLLGVEYVINRDDRKDCLSSLNYKYINTMGNKIIYHNNNAIPFGYLYDGIWEKGEVESFDEAGRTLAAVQGFYFSDSRQSGDVSGYEKRRDVGLEENNLLNREYASTDCQVAYTENGIRISDFAEDPNIVFSGIGEQLNNEPIHMIMMKINVEQETDMALYYKRFNQKNFSQDQVLIFQVSPDNQEWRYFIPGDVEDIRIDVSDGAEEVEIVKLAVSNCQEENKAYRELQNSEVSEIEYQEGIYSARVKNSGETSRMLCVPLMYASGWQASIDGKEAEIYNINSGLCGIEIPAGNHTVVLHYELPHEKLGDVLTAVGLTVGVLLLLWEEYRKRQNRKKG